MSQLESHSHHAGEGDDKQAINYRAISRPSVLIR